MGFQIVRGSRSEKYAADDWKCDCGHINKTKQFLIFDLPPFYCLNCKNMYPGIVYFNLADVEINGRSIIPEVKNQGDKPECAPFAFANAQELNDAVEALIMCDDSAIESLDPMVLANAYDHIFLHATNDEYCGLHKFLYTAKILSEKNREVQKDVERSTYSDCCIVNKTKFEHVCECIADGRGVVGCFRAGKRLADLQFGQVYCETEDIDAPLHAVVLIGAIFYHNSIIYIFLNSWGKSFCAIKDENGEILTGGIGMVETALSCNPIVLGRSWEQAHDGKFAVSWKRKGDLSSAQRIDEVDQLSESRGRGTFINKKIWDSCKGCLTKDADCLHEGLRSSNLINKMPSPTSSHSEKKVAFECSMDMEVICPNIVLFISLWNQLHFCRTTESIVASPFVFLLTDIDIPSVFNDDEDVCGGISYLHYKVPNSGMALLQAAVGVSQGKALDMDMGSCPLANFTTLWAHQEVLTFDFKELARVRNRNMAGISSGQFQGTRWRQRLWKGAAVCTQIFEGHSDAIISTRFINKGSETEGSLLVVTGSKDRSLRLYKCSASSTIMGHKQGVTAVTCLEQKMIYSASWDQSARQWDVRIVKETWNMVLCADWWKGNIIGGADSELCASSNVLPYAF